MPPAHLLLVFAICLAWGANFLAAARAVVHFPPVFCTALRLGIVVVCLSPWLRPLPREQRILGGGVALITGAIHFGLVFAALRLAGDISSVSITMQSYIPMSAVLAWLLLDERLEWRIALGIGFAFAGVLVLGFDPLVLDAPAALLLSLASALALALGTTLTRKLQGINVFQLQAWSAALGVPFLLAASALVEQGQLASLTSVDALAWAGVAYSALGSSIFGHAMVFWLVQRHPVARVTPFLLLTPVVSVTLGVLFWGDRPGPKLLLGGAMVLAGVLYISWRAARRTAGVLVRSQ